MSALLPKADIRQRIEHVCFVPQADMRPDLTAKRPIKPGCKRLTTGGRTPPDGEKKALSGGARVTNFEAFCS
jgi:hypothetical protein